MTAFQAISLSGITLIAVLIVLATIRRRMSRGSGFAWLLLWIAAGLAIAMPELTVVVARALGIQRGADLVLYVAVLASFAGFFAVFIRLRRLEGSITEIVRHIAVDEARQPEGARNGGDMGGDV